MAETRGWAVDQIAQLRERVREQEQQIADLQVEIGGMEGDVLIERDARRRAEYDRAEKAEARVKELEAETKRLRLALDMAKEGSVYVSALRSREAKLAAYRAFVATCPTVEQIEWLIKHLDLYDRMLAEVAAPLAGRTYEPNPEMQNDLRKMQDALRKVDEVDPQ